MMKRYFSEPKLKAVICGLTITMCLLGFAIPATTAQAPRKSTPSPTIRNQFIDIDGRKVWIEIAGTGTPTVVFDSGFGDSLESWSQVFPEVARFTRAVAYDRAGLGKSEAGTEPRSFTEIATELHTLLRRANIAPPYVLVGHSMGGAHIRAFASLFKDEVAGLVFVDPFTEKIFGIDQKETEANFALQDAAVKNAPAGRQAEWRFLKGEVLSNFPQLRTYGKPPDVPTMLLVAGRGRPSHWVDTVLGQYGKWIADAHEGGLVVTPDSTHYIQRDDPALVISAIRRVVFPSVRNVLERAIKEKGADAAVVLSRQMKSRYPAEFFRESVLNTLGYQQLNSKHAEGAIKLFKLNVEMYPKSSNTYDSLAEAYMIHGDKTAAIKNYRMSLALNPKNTNGAAMLKKLLDAR